MLHSWKIRYLFVTTNPLAKDSFPGIAGDCPWRGLGSGATGWIMLQVLPAILWPSPSHVWSFWFQCRPIPSELWVFKIAFLHSSLIVSLHLFETEIDDLYSSYVDIPPNKVSLVNWKMHHYGGFTPKPHYAYANSEVIRKLDKGKLVQWQQKSLDDGRPMPKSCETYRNSKGEKCFKGTKFLKRTETLALYFCHPLLNMAIRWCLVGFYQKGISIHLVLGDWNINL